MCAVLDALLSAQATWLKLLCKLSLQGLGLAPVLCEHLEAMNFNAPTRIQQATLPVLLVGSANTPPPPLPLHLHLSVYHCCATSFVTVLCFVDAHHPEEEEQVLRCFDF